MLQNIEKQLSLQNIVFYAYWPRFELPAHRVLLFRFVRNLNIALHRAATSSHCPNSVGGIFLPMTYTQHYFYSLLT